MNAQETALHNKIYQILETGSSSFHLLQDLAETIQNPVLLLNDHFEGVNFDLPKNPIRISSILEDRHETSEFQNNCWNKVIHYYAFIKNRFIYS